MLQRFHDRVGTAGLIVAIIALVVALGGGAYAASGALTGKQKKEVEKIAKKYAGKPGAEGKQGPAGATGPAGAKGDAGAKGEKGDAGSAGISGAAGTPGKNGTSVEQIAGEPTACKGAGGTTYELEENPTAVCNGSPWTAGGVLPKGATETGSWSFHANSGEKVLVPISFSVPLNAALLEEKVHIVGPTGGGVCTGSRTAPTAPEGELCVYESEVSGASLGTEGGIYQLNFAAFGANKAGALIYFETVSNGAFGFGDFAVTGS